MCTDFAPNIQLFFLSHITTYTWKCTDKQESNENLDVYDILHFLEMDPDSFYACKSMSMAIANVRCFFPMHAKMFLQMWPGAEMFPTFTARIRSFSGVCTHVKYEMIKPRKLFSTSATNAWFFTGMSRHVPLQALCSCKFPIAVSAFKWRPANS